MLTWLIFQVLTQVLWKLDKLLTMSQKGSNFTPTKTNPANVLAQDPVAADSVPELDVAVEE